MTVRGMSSRDSVVVRPLPEARTILIIIIRMILEFPLDEYR